MSIRANDGYQFGRNQKGTFFLKKRIGTTGRVPHFFIFQGGSCTAYSVNQGNKIS
jgi:hypothetical protein